MAADLDPELIQQPLGHRTSSHPGSRFAGARPFEDVSSIETIVLEQAGQVGMARAGTGYPAAAQLTWWIGAFVGHHVFPIGPIAIGNEHGQGRAECLAGAEAGQPLDAVTLDLHAGPAAIALHPAGELAVHPFRRDRKTSRQSLDDGDKGLAMRFACGGEAEHRDRVLERRSALAGY
jgi:hypothetical protein